MRPRASRPAERDVVRRHVGVPDHRVVDGGVGEVEQARGHVEQAGADAAEVEVGAHHLGVDVVLLLADQLLVVGVVDAVDRGRVGVVDAQPREQDVAVALGGLLGDLGDPLDELGDRRALADHLHAGVVVGPGVVADQPGELLAQLEQLAQERLVLRVALVEERGDHLAAYVAVLAEGAHRDRVGVVGGDGDQAVVARPGARRASPAAGRRAARGRRGWCACRRGCSC